MGVELTLLARVAYRDREVTGPRLRGLLALLADGPRPGSSTASLVDGLWPARRPENPVKALQVVVSRARAQLGPELIRSTPAGYRLELTDEQIDAAVVRRQAVLAAERARVGDHAGSLAAAEAGLALWQVRPDDPAGALAPPSPTADADAGADPDDPVAGLRARRAGTRRALARARALALSRLGRRAEAADALAALVGPAGAGAADGPGDPGGPPPDEAPADQESADEEVLAELLRCRAATAGPAAALAHYERHRRALRERLGVEPGPALRAVHQELLRADLPATRRGVGHEPNPLLGRDADVAAVAELLRSARVTSVVGPGGLGKTRLAQTVARRAEQPTVHLIALAGMAADGVQPADVLGEVAVALGVGELHPATGIPLRRAELVSRVVEALGPGPALLVLDNCEHVVRGAADLVAALVATTGDWLRVLTTGRTPLGLSAESVYPLPQLSQETTVALFTARARAARPDVTLPADQVAQLCGQLDGLPLAVELAAARVRVLSVPEIARRLVDRFALLRGGARDRPSRHRTLHAVVDWSWNLLDDDGRAAMRALSAFPDGFTADAAAALLDRPDPLDVLEHLVDQSLLRVTDTASGSRFRMLETVREFATGAREAAGESAVVTDRLLGWARALGTAGHEPLFGTEPDAALAVVRTERENLLHALRTAVTRGDAATTAGTAAALGGLWTIESQYQRMGQLYEGAAPLLDRFRPGPELVEATRAALVTLVLHAFLVHGPRATRTLRALRLLPPAPPDTLVRAAAVLLSGPLDDPDRLAGLTARPEPLLSGLAAAADSYRCESEGRLEQAVRAAERMLDSYRARPVLWLGAMAHSRISELALQLEQGERARRHISAALPLFGRLGASEDAVGSTWWMVLCNLQAGDLDEAERWLVRTAPDPERDPAELPVYGAAVRAEIQLARGRVEDGLARWRAVLAQLADGPTDTDPDTAPGTDQWTTEAIAVAVVAHARQDRSELVAEQVATLPGRLVELLRSTADRASPPYLLPLASSGALLLALGAVALERARTSGDPAVADTGARLIALADRCRYLRSFQPTMSSAQARRDAEAADRAAYADAVSDYADRSAAELRAAGLELVRRLAAATPAAVQIRL